MEGLVYFDGAGFGKFNSGVFEAIIGSRGAAGGENDAIYTDHFFGAVVLEYDTLGGFVLFEGDDFAAGKSSDAESAKVIRYSLADFWVFGREETGSTFHDEDFGAELSIVFGDFASSGTAADDESRLR